MGTVVAAFTSAFISAAPGALDPESSAIIAGAHSALVLLAIYSVAAVAFDIWALVAIGNRRTIARLLVTVAPVLMVSVNIAATMMSGAGGAEGGVSIVFAIPLNAALIILLWLPPSSREYFGDVLPGSAAPQSPAPRPFVHAEEPVTMPIRLPRPPGPSLAPAGHAHLSTQRRA